MNLHSNRPIIKGRGILAVPTEDGEEIKMRLAIWLIAFSALMSMNHYIGEKYTVMGLIITVIIAAICLIQDVKEIFK